LNAVEIISTLRRGGVVATWLLLLQRDVSSLDKKYERSGIEALSIQ
jgi:hypothetical protein